METEKILEIIRFAGNSVLEMEGARDLHVKDKGGSDPLTDADLKSNEILSALKEQVSGSWFFSEENADDLQRLSCSWVWIVDPIDGTREYVERIPQYSVSVALCHQRRLIFSAVYNPHDSLCWQSEGRFFCEQLKEDQVFADSEAILVSRSERKRGLFLALEKEFKIVDVGSIAYKLSLLAQKRCKAVVSLCHKNEWDIAGGSGLCEAAGMVCCDIYGRRIRWNHNEKVKGIVAGDWRFVREFLAGYNLKKMFEF